MKNLLWLPIVLLASGCARKNDSARAFTDGMKAYLAKRGDLCIGRSAWPVDVDAHETTAQSRDVVQLPVLDKLGLVESSRVTVDSMGMVDAKRYRLTARGRAFYLDRATRRPAAEPGEGADFCVARISLDKVVRWVVSERDAGSAEVAYTYLVDAPDWARDPDFLRAFPAVARVLGGARHAELTEGFTLTKDGWIANELLPTAPAVAARPKPPAHP
jgi:hypothetical protein